MADKKEADDEKNGGRKPYWAVFVKGPDGTTEGVPVDRTVSIGKSPRIGDINLRIREPKPAKYFQNNYATETYKELGRDEFLIYEDNGKLWVDKGGSVPTRLVQVGHVKGVGIGRGKYPIDEKDYLRMLGYEITFKKLDEEDSCR